MCGIIGAVSTFGAPREWVTHEIGALAHRGPDDVGHFESEDHRVVLGHRRLAIIDTSRLGHQPMSSADASVTLAWNGEIYNHVELRAELERLGHRFVSRSDTEVLLNAYRQWGPACVERLVGMWAIALYDAVRRVVWLSRDPFGIKPLYVIARPDLLAFASEPQPLLSLAPRTINPQVAYDFLCWGHTDRTRHTFLTDIERVSPGVGLTVSIDDLETRETRLVALPARRTTAENADNHAARTLRELLSHSVELHMRSDVPVGAALSGGLDSSTIVMLMRAVAGRSAEIHAFSFVSPGDPTDEQQYAEAVARAAAATMHAVAITDEDVTLLAEEASSAQFEPFGSFSILAQHAVFREARRRGVTVMLGGQGADELFAGYPALLVEHFVEMIRRGQLPGATRAARAIAAELGPFAVARGLARALPRRFAAPLWARWMRRTVPDWLDVEWFATHDAIVAPRPHDLPASFDAAVDLAQTETSLPALLRYEDRNSMASSIESRVPYLTPALAAFAAGNAASLLFGDGVRKSLLIDAARGLVPDVVLDRRRKVPFAVPESRWLAAVNAASSAAEDDGVVAGLRPGAARVHARAWSYQRFARRLGTAAPLAR